jgi:hypothetical protein
MPVVLAVGDELERSAAGWKTLDGSAMAHLQPIETRRQDGRDH